MRKILQYIFKPFFLWADKVFSGTPKRLLVFSSLDRILSKKFLLAKKKIITIDNFLNKKYIIFSDQHKGNNSNANDFENNENTYLYALNHYYEKGFTLMNLGDSEELWKFDVNEVILNNEKNLIAEVQFFQKNRYFKVFGNHDLDWANDKIVHDNLNKYFKRPLKVVEAIVLQDKINGIPFKIICTHGHQGDMSSDGNLFSKWLVKNIWSPIQNYLGIKLNTPSNDINLRHKHNRMMYEWSANKKNILLITGHTHKPVFASGKYTNKLEHKIMDEAVKPTYFNTGCCCYNDGDITGIEIENGRISLVKFTFDNTENCFKKHPPKESELLSRIIKDNQ